MNTFKNTKPVVAIDGTAGSGKGTLARNLAEKLNFDHLDTGILYRIYAFENQKKQGNIESINLDKWLKNDQKLAQLRTEEISKIASIISQKKEVRDQLIEIQRKFADNPPGKNGSIIDGRDIGTVITPDAEIKFFIDANVEIRALRRIKQLNLNTEESKETLKNMIERDNQDIKRQISPLRRAKDCFCIDTSNINENEVLALALNHIKKKLILFNNCI